MQEKSIGRKTKGTIFYKTRYTKKLPEFGKLVIVKLKDGSYTCRARYPSSNLFHHNKESEIPNDAYHWDLPGVPYHFALIRPNEVIEHAEIPK